MAQPRKPIRALRHFLIPLIAAYITVAAAATALLSPTPAQSEPTGRSFTVPSLPYPVSGLRQRLIAEGKSPPNVDESLQTGIPALYFEPNADTGTFKAPYPAIVALPDCDNHFPAQWITILHEAGYAILLISPPKAHPAQDYCGGGKLQAPKHGLSYWAFDAISALHFLTEQTSIDGQNIAVFGYGYGAGAAQLAIYRDGHAKHYQHRFKALVGLRPQCMSEMDNFAPSMLVGIEKDPFNPPAWCHWRVDRDLRPGRTPVTFRTIESAQPLGNQTTRTQLSVETDASTVDLIIDFLSEALSG
tara:strand:- start:401 stop:1306 length:906 start_codon:yes stop_codon:yes gene_type:complete